MTKKYQVRKTFAVSGQTYVLHNTNDLQNALTVYREVLESVHDEDTYELVEVIARRQGVS